VQPSQQLGFQRVAGLHEGQIKITGDIVTSNLVTWDLVS